MATMGAELNTKSKPGLNFNRHITGFVAGTSPIKEIEFIRNGKTFHTIQPKSAHHEFAIDDMELLSKHVLSSTNERPPFVYYYLRAIQEDGHIAWSSPIWIDQTEVPSSNAPAAPKKAKKSK